VLQADAPFAALDGETALVIEADSAPLDDAKPALKSGKFQVTSRGRRGRAVRA